MLKKQLLALCGQARHYDHTCTWLAIELHPQNVCSTAHNTHETASITRGTPYITHQTHHTYHNTKHSSVITHQASHVAHQTHQTTQHHNINHTNQKPYHPSPKTPHVCATPPPLQNRVTFALFFPITFAFPLNSWKGLPSVAFWTSPGHRCRPVSPPTTYNCLRFYQK